MSATEQRLRAPSPEGAAADEPIGELGELAPLVAGEERRTGNRVVVSSPYDGKPVAVVHRAGPTEIEYAIAAATEAFEQPRAPVSYTQLTLPTIA